MKSTARMTEEAIRTIEAVDSGNPVHFDEYYSHLGTKKYADSIYVVVYRHLDAQRSVTAVVVEYTRIASPAALLGTAPEPYDSYTTIDPDRFGEGIYADVTPGRVEDLVRSIVMDAGHDIHSADWYGRIIA